MTEIKVLLNTFYLTRNYAVGKRTSNKQGSYMDFMEHISGIVECQQWKTRRFAKSYFHNSHSQIRKYEKLFRNM